jgi:hypothetical protein
VSEVVSKGKKWSKKDLKSLRGAIDYWWTFNALYLRSGVTKEQVFTSMPSGERRRIIIAHWRGFAAMLEERALGHCGYRATHEHYESKRGVAGWGNVTETVERFRRLERETLEDAKKARALADRVESEGLPTDLESYITPDR